MPQKVSNGAPERLNKSIRRKADRWCRMESSRNNPAPGSEAPSAIFLVDIDAFFAQVEQVLRPELRGRPVIVGGLATDRSVVASASYEARARGVRTAMPTREARRLCPDAVFLRGDFHAYARFSEAMMELCRR